MGHTKKKIIISSTKPILGYNFFSYKTICYYSKSEKIQKNYLFKLFF